MPLRRLSNECGSDAFTNPPSDVNLSHIPDAELKRIARPHLKDADYAANFKGPGRPLFAPHAQNGNFMSREGVAFCGSTQEFAG
jgi:hypothetical protein